MALLQVAKMVKHIAVVIPMLEQERVEIATERVVIVLSSINLATIPNRMH